MTTQLAPTLLKELDVDGWYDGNNTRYTEETEGRRQTGFDSETGTLYLYFQSATSIVAGKPYIIKWASGSDITTPVFSNVTISNTLTDVVSADGTLAFAGTYSPMTITGEDKSMLYLGSDNTLYYPNASMTINACRAFFQLYGIEAGDTGTQSIKAFNLNFGDDTATEETTSISFRREVGSEADAWFTLDGRKLIGKPSRAGVYINNGKKVILQ